MGKIRLLCEGIIALIALPFVIIFLLIAGMAIASAIDNMPPIQVQPVNEQKTLEDFD